MKHLSVALVVMLLAACGGTSEPASDSNAPEPSQSTKAAERDLSDVSRADFGKRWPLTVSRGTLQCIGSKSSGAVVFIAPSGQQYAVNGTAQSQLQHVPDVDEIWADGSGGLKKDIGPLIERGLKLC